MTQWIVTCQSPPSMGFFRQEYYSGLSCPAPGGLPDPGIKPRSPALQVDSLPVDLSVDSEPLGKTKPLDNVLKGRDITLPTKVHLITATVFPVVMDGCKN